MKQLLHWELRYILLVTVAHNPSRKVESRYKISNKMFSEKVKKSYIGDFKCVLGNYVDS